jgi:hypothetical protein
LACFNSFIGLGLQTQSYEKFDSRLFINNINI